MALYRSFVILITVFFLLSQDLYAICPANQDPDRGDLRDSIQWYKNEGIRHAREGKLDHAKKLFQKELTYKEKAYSKKHPKIGNTYTNLGVVNKMEGKFEKALHYYQKADKIYSENPGFNPGKVGTNLQNMANIYSLYRDYEKAETYYTRAIKLFKKDSLNNLERLGMVYNNLGIFYKERGLHNKATNFYNKSILLKKRVDPEALYVTYGNLANSYRLLGNYKKSEEHFINAINQGIQQFGKESYLLNHHFLNFGLLKLDQKEYDQAKKLIKRSLDITVNNLGYVNSEASRCYEHLGLLCRLKGNYTQALQYYQRALVSLSDHFDDTTLQANPDPGEVISKSQLVNILKRKAKALAELKQNRKENLKTALSSYELALKTIGDLRTGYQSQESKLTLTANERETFINTIETAIELYQLTGESHFLNKAFRYAEESKAAVLYEAMQFNQALNMGNIPDSLESKEDQLKKDIWTFEELIFEERKKRKPNESRLNYWNERLFELNREYEALIDKFEQEYPRYHALKYEQSPMKVSHIQKKMRRGQTVIEYVLTERNIYAFLIDKKDFRLKTIPVDTSFTNKILSFRNLLSNRDFSNHSKKDFQRYNALAYQLYSKLIKPLNLEKNENLTIIPDDLLSYLPFEVLVTEKDRFNQINYNELAYMVKKYKIGYSYSAKVLYNQNLTDRNPVKKLAAFAPTYNNIEEITEYKSRTRQEYRERLYPLKGIKKEAQRITRIIKGDTYIDHDATEEVFKVQSGDYDILHLAMHTLVNDQEPMYSKMAFTQGKNDNEDGFLNTYEIYNLELNSRLAVLSSCNTGSGKLQKGEGVISLARGFKYAGCPSIVMTMWPVEDNSSIRLMEYFYQAISKGKSKDQALREAKLRFLENSDPLHSHPYFWAGYILIGNKTSLYEPLSVWWIIGGTAVLLGMIVVVFTRKKYRRRIS